MVFGFGGGDFAVEFGEALAHEVEDFSALAGQDVVFAGAGAGFGITGDFQPAAPRHAMEDGVKGAGADFVAVMAQLVEHPLAVDGRLGGMVQNMHLPKAQKNLAFGFFHVRDGVMGFAVS